LTVDQAFCWGVIIRAHGLKGEIRVQAAVDNPAPYQKLTTLWISNPKNQLQAFQIKSIKLLAGTEFLLNLETVNNRNAAEMLVGKQIYLPLEMLPKLSGKNFYYHDIIGFKLQDIISGDIGEIVEVRPMPAQDVLVVIHRLREVLIPIHDDFIEAIDYENRLFLTKLPEGLIAVYLE
jgi:16S rRNA processing protein RimM